MAPTNPPQTQDGRSMPILPNLQAEYKEISDQQHRKRSHTVQQALEAATDRYDLLADLTSSPSMNPLITKIKEEYAKELSACSNQVTAFVNITPHPDAGLQLFNQLMSTITNLTNTLETYHLEMHPGSGDSDLIPTAAQSGNTQQKEYRTHNQTPYSITSVANLFDLSNTGTTTHKQDSDASQTLSQDSDASHHDMTRTPPPPSLLQLGDSGQVFG